MNQEGITAHGNATITLKAKENNKITVENAAYSSDGISTLINRTGARPGTRDDGNKIILEAGGDNIVTMKSGDADADYVNNSKVLTERHHIIKANEVPTAFLPMATNRWSN